MTYFVTGATGFIGKRLVKKLLARRGGVVYFLIRQESRDKVPELLDYWGADRARTRFRSSAIWSSRCSEYRRLT